MEPSIIDVYNEEPHIVSIIEKMNQEFAKLQAKYDELQSNHEKLQLNHKLTNVNIKKLKKEIHNKIVHSPNHRDILSKKGLNWFWGKSPPHGIYDSQGVLLYTTTLAVKYTQ